MLAARRAARALAPRELREEADAAVRAAEADAAAAVAGAAAGAAGEDGGGGDGDGDGDDNDDVGEGGHEGQMVGLWYPTDARHFPAIGLGHCAAEKHAGMAATPAEAASAAGLADGTMITEYGFCWAYEGKVCTKQGPTLRRGSVADAAAREIAIWSGLPCTEDGAPFNAHATYWYLLGVTVSHGKYRHSIATLLVHPRRASMPPPATLSNQVATACI